MVDLPVIESFPATSEDEWRLYPSYGLRTADAYLLVYDVTNPASFSFIQMIRSSIAQISTLELSRSFTEPREEAPTKGILIIEIKNLFKSDWEIGTC